MHGFTPRLVANPWKEVTPADRKTTRHSFLSHEEFAVLIRKHRGHPLCAALATCTLAGLRARELTHLRTDIDMVLGDSAAASVIHVQSREGEHGWDTKNPNSVRTVPVHEDLYPLLVEHRESGYAGRRYFFRTSRADKPLGYWTLRDSAQSGFEAVGLRYGREGDALTLHSLRHTFASWLAQEGVASRDIARLMGNTADEVDRTYAHLMPSDDRRILGRMGNPLSGEKSGVSPSTR
jgi:integrase